MAAYQNPYLSGSNPYLQDTIDKAQGDVVRNYNLTAQPAFNAGMVKSGSFGNAGVQEMNTNAQRNLQDSLGNISSQLRNADYTAGQNMYKWDQEFGRNLYNDSFNQNNTNLQTGIGLLNTMNGYNNQDLQNGTTIQNTPLNYYNQFTNIANGIGNGFGTESKTEGSTSNPALQALGGAQMGQSVWNRYGNQAQAAFSNTSAGSSGFGTGLAYGNQDYGQFF